MQNDFYSYLDSFNRITIIIDKGICNKNKTFCLLREIDALELEIESIEDLGLNNKFNCIVGESIQLNKDYVIYDESHNRSSLRSGKIVRSALFDMTYNYDGDLGFKYAKEATTFKIWTPVAKEVELELVSPQGKVAFYDLEYFNQGVWQIKIDGDIEKYSYRYNVRVHDKFEVVNDPYGISSNANAQYNYVIDLEKIYKFVKEKPNFSGNLVDAVIYETSIRDFTASETSGAVYKGKFLGMVENHPTKSGLPTGLPYLDYLGVTHLQLLPIFDFGGVDDLDSKISYNWGYNPVQYNVPEGSYSLNPNDPYSRINELCNLIDSAHANNIRVIMDVVFNHVYEMEKFPFDKLVPGYFYRVDNNGMLTNISGCGNDLATERKMMRKFIVDSLCFWAKTYRISGFRFDLMGLLDIETINLSYQALKKIDPNIICYGEGWNMPNTISEQLRPTMSNYVNLPQIAFFNDKFRNLMRGNQWHHSLGYANGNKINVSDLICLFTGSCIDNYLFDNPNCTINYVECHDNYTFYDYNKKVNFELPEKQLIDYQALGLSLVILSQGIPFIHSGQEFMRSKKGVENSYNSSDIINAINWQQRDDNIELVLLVKNLIKLRKSINEFRLLTPQLITKNITCLDQNNISTIFKIKSINCEYYMFIKNDYIMEEKNYGELTMIFDGRLIVNKNVENVILTKPGIVIYRKDEQ